MQLRLRTSQQAGADLRCTGAEQERRRNAASIGNAAGRDHWNSDGVDHGRQKREQTDLLPLGFGRVETAAVSPGFHTLGNHDISAGIFRGTGFRHR